MFCRSPGLKIKFLAISHCFQIPYTESALYNTTLQLYTKTKLIVHEQGCTK